MTSTIVTGTSPPDAQRPSVLATLGQRIRRWHDLARQRRHLANVDERTLRDIGISHIEARQEARRWFWDDPLARDKSDGGNARATEATIRTAIRSLP